MTLTISLVLLAPAIVLAVLFAWLGARPRDPLKGPRMVNWQVMMMIAAGASLALAVHVVALLRGASS